MNKAPILYSDQSILVVSKAPGLPVQNDKTGDTSLLDLLKIDHGRLHLINRIDRPASGAVLLAKSSSMSHKLNLLSRQRKISKHYLAAVKNIPESQEGELIHFLKKKGNKSYVSRNSEEGKRSVLTYKLIDQSDHYAFLEIDLNTGRFHQIRAQLAHIGSPIKGDVKYGARRANKDRSIHLHAWKLAFSHPISGDMITITAPLPDDPVWNALHQE